MSYKDPTYVIFDGDEDKWSYAFMLGWKKNDNIDFDFSNAHDLDNMTARAQGEEYVKRHLYGRMEKSKVAIVLIGKKTKNLHRFVRWEQELAQELDLPIIAVNLNGSRGQDDLCPPVIRDKCVLHIPFKMKIIKFALDNYVPQFKNFSIEMKAAGTRHYTDDVYEKFEL